MTTKKPSGHSHGFRHKSRSALTKQQPRGVAFLMREYKEGQQALVIVDPRQHKSLPHRRYHGKVGTITAVGRRAVTIDVDRKSTRLNSSHIPLSRMPSSA